MNTLRNKTKIPVLVVGLLFLAIFSTGLFAATKATTMAPAPASPKLDLQKSQSKVEFVVTGDLLTVTGHLSDEYKGPNALTGELFLKDNQLTGNAEYELNALTTEINKRDDHMKNTYLNVSTHPKAKLKLLPVGLPADQKVGTTQEIPFTGTMEVKGIPKPIAGKLAATKKEDGYDLNFKWAMKLSDFDINTPSFMNVTLTDTVNLDVNVQGKFQ